MAIILQVIFIICARIADVSLGSLRIIFLSKGRSRIAFLVAFLEIFIWFLVARDVLTSGEWWGIFPYSLGYALGTYVGSKINEKYVSGNLGVQVVTSCANIEILEAIRNRGYAVSVVDVKGIEHGKDKYMLFIEINKKKYCELKILLKELDPNAFIVVNETRYVLNGYFK